MLKSIFRAKCSIVLAPKIIQPCRPRWLSNLSSTVPVSEGLDSASADTSLSTLPERGPLPIICGRELSYVPPFREPRQAWVENLDTVEEKKIGMVDLHPSVFGAFPRVEILHRNVYWQTMYKHIDWSWMPTRYEISKTGRKPWPQKGTGRARHGNKKSPIWIRGEKVHGPRGPRTYFFMLPFYLRVQGLCVALSVKHAQDDLKIVDNLDIPSVDDKYLLDLVEKRKWGDTVLFVDGSDIVPKNIALATDSIGHINLMPAYGLNVYSMLKHETLVLTLSALEKIEEKLIYHLNRHDSITPARKYTSYSV